MKWRLRSAGMAIVAGVLVWAPQVAWAQQSSSAHYQVNEVFFGNGGDLQDCSTNYCAKTTVGETAIGNAKGTNYQTQAGFNTNREPYLQLIVAGGTSDLGYLSATAAKTITATFSVKTYLAGGYVVKLNGDPPTSSVAPHPQLHTLSTPTASSVGTEQFGINLAANTSPTSFGAAPVQVPNNTFSFGAATSGYNTANLFKYVKGDTIAQSTKSSGETDYTISYLFNISNTTVAGLYSFSQVLVVTSTY